MIIVDSNVLIDVAANDSEWAARSSSTLLAASLKGRLLINSIIYAELSARYSAIEELDNFIAQADLDIVDIPKAALFLAGKAFIRYRRAGGTRTGVLPDFFIGAHAATIGVPLLTRDVSKYRTYFPTIKLISPADPD
ncbi:MAG: type II toxin-antitoxin system VapC family toxin [Rhizobium sp.]|nr:type II toxin-antitoxin system VapC family toxin [Rhizobium sp.]